MPMSIRRLMFIATSVRSAPSTLKIALDHLAQRVDVGVVRSRTRRFGVDAGLRRGSRARCAADAEDVGQADLDLLLAREIDASNTSHDSALPLLVLGVALADDASHAVSA